MQEYQALGICGCGRKKIYAQTETALKKQKPARSFFK
jgi:hypothetical protein